MKNLLKISKYAVILMVVIGLIRTFYTKDGSHTLLIGLFFLFTSHEVTQDERSVAIKTSSAYIALIISYVITLVTTSLYSLNVISFQINEINYFLIMLFAMAIIIYHSWMYFTSK